MSSYRSRRRADSDDEDKNKDESSDDEIAYVPLKKRRQMENAKLSGMRGKTDAEEAAEREAEAARLREEILQDEDRRREEERTKMTLFEIAQKMREERGGREETQEEKDAKEEAKLLENLTNDRAALKSRKEHAHNTVYTKRMHSDWRPRKRHRAMTDKQKEKVLKKWHIVVEGDDLPPPLTTWEDMRLPKSVCDYMQGRGIMRPTPIQIQGIPVALAGRDMIGIAFTGSGKTLCFSIPLVMQALDAETRRPLVHGEGVCGMIINPSRELAGQTFEVVKGFCDAIEQAGGPQLRCMLAIGGLSMRDQNHLLTNGLHMVVATPGRLIDQLKRKAFNCEICKYLCLDEADRLIDLGFEDDMRQVFDQFGKQRQTVLFSATMPKKIQEFALTALVDPIIVNVGRAGATNLDVIQEVEYVKSEAKILYLLECLQKTAPPVLIFASNTSDVDDIHEYLLLKGVDCVAVHGGKDQQDRLDAIKQYRDGEKDILVATDVASKGLDFPDVQHVINFDMPKEIEDYVHRIGRTGRCGKTGVATTFINRECDETVLLDLKHILIEAKQRLPPVLAAMDDPDGDAPKVEGAKGACGYCGGLGHRTLKCPKLLSVHSGKMKNSYGYDDGGGAEV